MRGIRVWDVTGGQQDFKWDRLVTGPVLFSGDGKQLAWTGYDERSIQYPWVLEFSQAQPRRLGLPINNLPSTAAIAPDGKTLAVSTDANAVELRDLATGKEALPLDANTGRIFGLALTPDGRHLATFDQWRVLVWEKATGKLLRRFPDEADAANPDQPASVWDVRLGANGQLQRGNTNNTYGHWEEVGPAAVDRLQKLGLKDESGKPAFASFEGTVTDVLESPGAQHVAVRISAQPVGQIDRNARIVVRIWDTRTGMPLTHVQPPDGAHLGAFSPDNRMLVTNSLKRIVQLWDLATGQQRLSLHGHLGPTYYPARLSVLFTPDTRFLFTGGDDSQVLQWDLTGRALDAVWRTVQHAPKIQRELWEQLANADAHLAHKVLWELAADPAGTVAFMEPRLKPVEPPNAKEVADLIAQLDSDIFAKRQEAHDRIRQIGEPAVPAMRKAMAARPPLEQARRLEKLIGDLAAATGESLRSLRAIETLEHIATPDARRLLSKLSQGLLGMRLTQAATESLARLDAR
jgi:WD40 repeat protein